MVKNTFVAEVTFNKGFIFIRRSFKNHPTNGKFVKISQELKNIDPGSKYLISYRKIQNILLNSSSARDSPNECSSVTGSTNASEPRDHSNFEKRCNQKNFKHSKGVSIQYIYCKEKRWGEPTSHEFKKSELIFQLIFLYFFTRTRGNASDFFGWPILTSSFACALGQG